MVHERVCPRHEHLPVNYSSIPRWDTNSLHKLTRRAQHITIPIHLLEGTSNDMERTGQIGSRIAEENTDRLSNSSLEQFLRCQGAVMSAEYNHTQFFA